MIGGWLSVTVTVNEHVFVKVAASVAFQTTTFVPFGKVEPEAKPLVHRTEPPVQLSVKVGLV
jgi:hypothetical protein